MLIFIDRKLFSGQLESLVTQWNRNRKEFSPLYVPYSSSRLHIFALNLLRFYLKNSSIQKITRNLQKKLFLQQDISWSYYPFMVLPHGHLRIFSEAGMLPLFIVLWIMCLHTLHLLHPLVGKPLVILFIYLTLTAPKGWETELTNYLLLKASWSSPS